MDANKRKHVRLVRRKRHIRKKLQGTAERPRLSVFRSLNQIYAQAIDDVRGVTLFSASSLSKEIRAEIGTAGGTRSGAERVGALVARKAKQAGIDKLAFDRNGRKYHGRIAALAEAIRKEGIEV
jgi:large subunit ribosomal protein L18